MTDELAPSQEAVVSLRISSELSLLIEATIFETGLKRADVLRLSLERGLPILSSQLSQKSEA